MAMTKRGTLGNFRGSWQSGIAMLEIDGVGIPCENGPTVRALQACFGNAIGAGHTVNNQAFVGREVVYSVDDMMGMLEAFTPVEEWNGPEIPAEGIYINDAT